MDEYTIVIIVTTIGFFTLAAILLVPVWRFLSREEKLSENWTEDSLSGDSSDKPGSPTLTEDAP